MAMIIDSARYDAGVRRAEATTFAEAARLSPEDGGFVWLALSQPTPEDLSTFGTSLAISPLAVQDVLQNHERPKLEEYGDCDLVVVSTVRLDDPTQHIHIGELDILVGSRYVVVLSRSDNGIVARARTNLDEHPDLAAQGTVAGLWAVLDAVIDDYEQVVELLRHESELLAQRVFDGDRNESESIYQQQRRVQQLTRAVHPALAVLDSLARGESQRSPETFRPFLGDVRDRARGVSEETTMLSSALDGLLDANVAQVTVRQNVIIQKVSAWAAIAAAPTIITGVYGMNFRHFPELQWPLGYPFAIVLMILAVLALRWNFRRLGWL
jgi:magnesium transporter